MASDTEELYCICNKPADEFMIGCDACQNWFHGRCVNIQQHQSNDIETYHCPPCAKTHGTLTLKTRKNWHRHDYSETDENFHKATQAGTVHFVGELKNRNFLSPDDILLVKENGYNLIEELQACGFQVPVLVRNKEGLGAKIPPTDFSIHDVESHVGSMREIDVIDVAQQHNHKMLMREWTEYYNNPNKLKIFNVISLEFSKTSLAELVEPPDVVKQLSWVNQYWPDEALMDRFPQGQRHEKPKVQRYCLMGIKDSYTDFHIDFGGTSVWYHVLRGEKVFYLIEPTNANLTLFETWISSPNQSEVFFGDQVERCYKCTIRQGETIFLPTGWIHAVLTPMDSLVFGGNFLHSFNIDLQIRIYEIEKRTKTEPKYLFPNYETLHWYALQKMVKQATEYAAKTGETPPMHFLEGIRSISEALRIWVNKQEPLIPGSNSSTPNIQFIEVSNVPVTMKYSKMLKEAQALLKPYLQIMPEFDPARGPEEPSKAEEENPTESSSKKKKRRKRKATDDEEEDADPSHGKPKRRKKKASKKEDKKKSSSQEPPAPKLIIKGGEIKTPMTGTQPHPPPPIRSPSNDLSVYDFDDDEDKPPPKSCLNMSSPPPGSMASPGFSPKFSPTFTPPRSSLSQRSPSSVSTPSTPVKQTHQQILDIIRASSSGTNKPEEEGHPSYEKQTSHLDEYVHQQQKKVPENMLHRSSISSGEEGGSLDRLSMPTIQGGLNGNISDILQASYGTETDFTIDENIGRTSPNRRDAIQGMLSMSQGSVGGGTLGHSSPFIDRGKPGMRGLQRDAVAKRRRLSDDDGDDISGAGERMHTAYKDDEYVIWDSVAFDNVYFYPRLDLSDNEADHVFKPRGKQKKDDAWNPKAKLTPNCPKPERPHREGVRKTSVESQLEDAAGKLANKPVPKRQYNKKQRPTECLLDKYRKPINRLTSPGNKLSTPNHYGGPSTSYGEPGDLVISPTKDEQEELMKKCECANCHKNRGKPGEAKPKKPKKGMATSKQRLEKRMKLMKKRF